MNSSVKPLKRRLPDWVKAPLPKGENYFRLKSLVRRHGLHTVCESASCPNIGECWDAGTLTIMILGDTCTRACRFCDVPTGNLQLPREEEPDEVAKMLSKLNLGYTVITSVDRDDLKDGGASHWAETLKAVKVHCPAMKVEALIPDFRGESSLVRTVCEAGPDVLAHNLETVPSLQAKVRPQCRYKWSLDTLYFAGKNFDLLTKSSLMLGLGEKRQEVIETMQDLVNIGCNILTLGQYLRPSRNHMEVEEYLPPEVFAEYKEIGESLGLDHVEAGPLVRSSYHAEKQLQVLNQR
ncbi:MAG: lipoyl synthase [Nitrospinaceae bacterium]|nr:MAG: lipoyl synthase [Nitrospinaceae bacterium]